MALRPMRRRSVLHHRFVPAAIALIVLTSVVVAFLVLPAADADGAALVRNAGEWAAAQVTRASPYPIS